MGLDVLRLENVSKSYNSHEVLKKLNLTISQGEIFGLIGPSGAGKTTLLNLLIGFLAPTHGKVMFGSKKNTMLSVIGHDHEIKQSIGFASQEPSFYKELSVEENLDLFGSLYELSADAKETNATILLKLMELYEHRKTFAKNLSGGMQKRLDIACAMVHNPRVLILDEPTADLDPHLRYQMWHLIKKINSKGTTIILSSHFLDELEDLCDRVGILWKGNIDHIGSPAELLESVDVYDEIHLETLHGNYQRVIDAFMPMEQFHISEIDNREHKLILYTASPHKVVSKIFSIVEKNEDVIVSLHVKSPTLNEVFEYLVTSDNEALQHSKSKIKITSGIHPRIKRLKREAA